MSLYKVNSVLNDIKAVRKGRILQRLWNKFIWRNAVKIIRKFTK